ncbi:metallophosphoesterase [Promethearchaeum syntrophicum]|uniref:Metallophosphoesterase n=1 Tax=Promethearchaeum syntrophicum TaxID=2594042 RepID=A0A5B9D5F0_9ARCH|nr:metallophosphoesterase [Candidatus Prometheoarchaeum syntrophicum]QEE14265.1 serine/threonine protein phosphatase 1 [Candidatus Prometheoarchaeum syntrophicum]
MRPFDRRYVPKFIQSFVETPSVYLIMKDITPFTLHQLAQIWIKYQQVSQEFSNAVYLDKINSENFNNLLIVGDTHGDLNSTLRIVKPFFEGKVDSILFLGDYVDRGEQSYLNFFFLVSMSILWPERVILLRGNHEDLELNLLFGFYEELQNYFPINKEFQAVLSIINAIYNLMPLVAITPKHSVCMHAGIPKSIPSLQLFDQIPKPHIGYRNISDKTLKKNLFDAFVQVRWNDPIITNLKMKDERSYHGHFYYTHDEVKQFLELNNQKRIIRSHEDIRGGYQMVFSDVLYHIFSSEPYFGQIKKAFTIHELTPGDITLRDLDFNMKLKIM